MENNEQLFSIINGFISNIGQLNGSLNALRDAINQLPNTQTINEKIANLEKTFIRETENQHKDIVCSDDISDLESIIKIKIDEVKKMIEEIEKRYAEGMRNHSTTSSADVVELAKVLTGASVRQHELDTQKDLTLDANNLTKNKMGHLIEKHKLWFAFVPIFGAGMFAFIKWIAPHMTQIIALFK